MRRGLLVGWVSITCLAFMIMLYALQVHNLPVQDQRSTEVLPSDQPLEPSGSFTSADGSDSIPVIQSSDTVQDPTKTALQSSPPMPSISVLSRVFQGATLELWVCLMSSYLLFWPWQTWTNSDFVLVWDEDVQADHHIATLYANLPPYPKTIFEPRPPPGTLCLSPGHDNDGYSRQMYSNFYCDLYSDADFIAIVDSDSYFITLVTPKDLFDFDKDNNPIPRIIGINGCCTPWCESIQEAIGGRCFGEFMIAQGFPMLFRRSHFPLMRQHITRQMNTTTFEEAFGKICGNYFGKYSQFDLMVHYLWYHHRDEYAWHIRDGPPSGHRDLSRRYFEDPEVLAKDVPRVSLMKHEGFPTDVQLFRMTDFFCYASGYKAGHCAKFRDQEVENLAKLNLQVDWTETIPKSRERGFPYYGDRQLAEHPWVGFNTTIKEKAIADHNRNLEEYSDLFKFQSFEVESSKDES